MDGVVGRRDCMSKHRLTFLGDVGPQRLADIVSGKLLIRQTNAKMSKPHYYMTKNNKIRTYFDFEFHDDLTNEEFAEWVAEGISTDFRNARFVVFVADLDVGANIVDVKVDPGPPIEINPPGLMR